MYKIYSPATSANLASGFDCFGVCFNTANEMTFEEFDGAVVINNHADTMRNKENLIVKSFYYACDVLDFKPKGLKLDAKSNVPISRGLGSSASCITAGVSAAYLISGNKPNTSEIFEISTIIEGHPDNVAPNLFGGAVISYKNDGKYKCANFNVHEKYNFISIVPEYKLSTSKAREVLPADYSREDCVFNISHAGIMVLALISGNDVLLSDSLHDKLHQPYRAQFIKDYDKIIQIAVECGALGCYLSGAGPTIIAVASEERITALLAKSLRDAGIIANVSANKINRKGLEYLTV